jgi:hypothetical protein
MDSEINPIREDKSKYLVRKSLNGTDRKTIRKVPSN